MIALCIVVHPADAFVEGADDARDLGIDVDIGSLRQKPETGAQMRLVRPDFARQGAREKAGADRTDVFVAREQARGKIGGHWSGPSG